jgi:hypothetical protein
VRLVQAVGRERGHFAELVGELGQDAVTDLDQALQAAAAQGRDDRLGEALGDHLGGRLGPVATRDQHLALGILQRGQGARVDLARHEDLDRLQGHVLGEPRGRRVAQHAWGLLQERVAAAGVDRDLAVVLAEGGDVDLFRELVEDRVAPIEEIGGAAGARDLLVELVQFLQVAIDRLDGLGDPLIGIAAQLLDHRRITRDLAEQILDRA